MVNLSTYVMSDIHGCYNKFISMLDKIKFGDNDQLILAGDYIDRGTQNIEMLKWIKNAPDNILLVKGNHDIEFAECIDIISAVIKKYNIDDENIKGQKLIKICQLFKETFNNDMFDYYGTLKQLFEKEDVNFEDLIKWKQIIDDMPYYYKLSVNGKKCIIVHAGYISDSNYELVKDKYENKESFYIYSREDSLYYSGLKNTIIVSGHTPTVASGKFYNNGNICKHVDSKNNCIFYNIDCGISYRSSKCQEAKLACIRLDDEKVYYV